jgi:D-serine deaminase-like pyridoxal phosphate-dependent protein
MSDNLQRPRNIAAAGLGPNAALIGQPGGRNRLMTPCLVLDLPALDRNIARMASLCRERGVALRPHAKTHKSVEIARRQIAAGAVGICTATLGEAEILVGGGIGDVLITSVIVGAGKHARLMRLMRSKASVAIVVDDLGVAQQIAAAAGREGLVIPVYMDVDMGRHRSGVPSIEQAVALADFLHASPAFTFKGLQGYAGYLSHEENFAARAEGATAAAGWLQSIRSALVERGIPVERISGASTGSALIDLGMQTFNELQCGSYICMDVEYEAVPLDRSARALFEPALFVRATVISKIVPGQATIDAGHKHFAGTLAPRVARGIAAPAEAKPNSDEHGFVTMAPADDTLCIGDTIECVPPHCDPTINLYNHYHVVDGDDLVAIWPVDARGAF